MEADSTADLLAEADQEYNRVACSDPTWLLVERYAPLHDIQRRKGCQQQSDRFYYLRCSRMPFLMCSFSFVGLSFRAQ